ncbi:MAG: hypothetical protein KAW17_12485 [Candidatus Eisenbacteria sp.]|nr:hypothetical protein [Candidatus Eisenbacteria bacterium]
MQDKPRGYDELAMKATASTWTALWSDLILIAIGVMSSIAAGQVPDWLKPYLQWAWVVLVGLVALRIVLRLLAHREHLRNRAAALEELKRASRARCAERWQAAGVPREEAVALTEDPFVGAPGAGLLSEPDKPVLLLIGDMGTGKSLIAERLLQGAIERATIRRDAPLPVYLQAKDLSASLAHAAKEETRKLGDCRALGATVVIDGAEEAGIGAAGDLVRQARILVGSWPNTSAIITSRIVPTVANLEEAAMVPKLSEPEALALVARFAQRRIEAWDAEQWPKSVQETIRRPLFAVVLGILLREQKGQVPGSTADLVTGLVERCLGRAKVDTASADALLKKLATLSIDRRGGSVPSCEVGTREEIAQLLGSGLVVERAGALSFPLAMLAEWFGAQSLADGEPKPSDLAESPQRADCWRYPLVVACGSFSHDQVSELVAPTVESDPALAAVVVDEALDRCGSRGDVSLPLPRECGRRIRESMATWIRGIGPLAKLIAPVCGDGALRPIVVSTRGESLSVAWYEGADRVDDVTELTGGWWDSDPADRDWHTVYGVSTGNQSAWAWRWSLDKLADNLTEILDKRLLPLEGGGLMDEAIWEIALRITGSGSLSQGPLSLEDIRKGLPESPKGTSLASVPGRVYRLNLIRALKARVEQLLGDGDKAMRPPWPGPDRGFHGGYIWEPFSEDQMLARARAVYTAALEGYQELVKSWFPGFGHRLGTAALLPVRLVGIVRPGKRGRGYDGSPGFSWYMEPLPAGSRTTVDLEIGREDFRFEDPGVQFAADRLRALRPDQAGWLSLSLHWGGLDVFQPDSATKIAYEWLVDDLRSVSWVR